MPAPAGTGLSRRSFLRAPPGSRSPSTAATQDGFAGVRRRDRPRRRGAVGPRARSRSSSRAAPTRSRASSPTAIRGTGICARNWRCRRRPGSASARTRVCAGTRRLASMATLHGEGKVAVMPSIGYASPDQSHFTSRHYWEVGAPTPAPHRLARPLSRQGRNAGQSAPGAVALHALHPRSRLQGPGRGSSTAPRHGFRTNEVEARSDGDLQTLGAARHTAESKGTALGAPALARSRFGCASRSCRSSRDNQPAHEPGHVSEDDDNSRDRLAGLAAMLAGACRCTASRSRLRGGTTRTPSRPTRCATRSS